MSSCNLAESIHNKWKQQSGDRGSDLFVATVDDFVRSFMQSVAYYQYLKGDRAGTGPTKEELKLRIAQKSTERTGNSKSLHEALAKMPGAEEFCTRTPQLEGEEVFLSLKRKADVPIGSEFDSHRPDMISISRPRVQTRSARNNVLNLNASPVELADSPQALEKLDVPVQVPEPTPAAALNHVTSVQETACDESQWHIARLPKTSAKACFAQQAVTKKKCIARIVQDGKSTAAPTYTGLMDNYRKNRKDRMQFFFCNDDIERCVKGTRRKWVMSRPEVPEIWPVKNGTNLTRKEILALENAGFRLPQREVISPRRLFQDHPLPVDLSSYATPAFPDEVPKRRHGKNVRRNKKSPSIKQANNCASAGAYKGRIRKVDMVPVPALGCIVTLDSGTPSTIQQYHLTISQFPDCSCPYFKEMLTKAKGGRSQWAHCKHLYFVFTVICGFDADVDAFIHAPTLSFNEVKLVLESGLLTHPTS
jgi:hypothetical protein